MRWWYVSAPILIASEKLSAPAGTSMNSWKSSEFWAWAPPFTTLRSGTGSTRALAPPTTAVERHPRIGGGRLRDGERRSEDRVRAEPRLRRGAVERDERAVDAALVGGVEPEERVGDLAVDVADRAGDPLPQPGVAAVAELDGLVLTGRGTGWHRREPEGSRIEPHLDLDGRIPARVEDLAAVDMDDRCHALFAKRDSAEAESRGLIPACGGADP